MIDVVSILLAVSEPNFVGILRSNFVLGGFEVIDNDVYHRNYLIEIIELEKPSILVIHDTYLPSDHSSPKEKDDEMLEILTYLRTTYDSSIRIVYLCERERKDPFLGSLVARNVLDIFNERKISTEQFIVQLSEPPKYANVAKFGIGELEVEFEEEEIPPNDDGSVEEVVEGKAEENHPPAFSRETDRARQILSQISGKAKTIVEAGSEWNQSRKEKSKETDTDSEPLDHSLYTKHQAEHDFDEYIDLMPIPKEVYNRSQVIGTVVVAVAGAKEHLGSTHTAMSIAAYLRKFGHSVALIELNGSEDFDRIHALYEGEKQYIRHQMMFEYAGIDHYKFREDMRLGEIMATYEYVVLDIGAYEDSPGYDEYLRSHVRLMLTSPYEWKEHWTQRFINRVSDAESYTFVVPFAERKNVEDMQDRFPDLHIVPFPSTSNPYKSNAEVDDVLKDTLQGFIKDGGTALSKKGIIVASLVSAAVTAVVISAFTFL